MCLSTDLFEGASWDAVTLLDKKEGYMHCQESGDINITIYFGTILSLLKGIPN